MRRILLFSAILITAALSVSCGSARVASNYKPAAQTAGGDSVLTFIQITDTQIGFQDTSAHFRVSDSLMMCAVRAINHIRPACVIHTGDLVNDFGNEEQKAIYTRLMSLIDTSIPVFVVPGNHDIRGWTAEKHDRYVRFAGYDRFSEKIGDCAFIGFDSNCIRDNATDAEEEQFAWLEEELKKAQGSKHIFLFCHCPVAMVALYEADGHNNFPKGKRARYIELFSRYGVEGIFSGHSHVGGYFKGGGIRHVNSIPVAKAFLTGFSGINVVTVTDNGFTFKWMRGF